MPMKCAEMPPRKPDLIQRAMERMQAKGLEHNTSLVSFHDYCPCGARSATTLVHREALRACVEADHDNLEASEDHLIDTVVFSILAYDEIQHLKTKRLLAGGA